MSLAQLPVLVELLALGVHDLEVRWRAVCLPLGRDLPDDVARRLCGNVVHDAVLHSTSWRHSGRELVLTYATFPDELAAAAGQPLQHHLVTGPGPREPSPAAVGQEHVAAHAVRHLAFLADGRDPHIAACTARRPREWRVLLQHGRSVHVPGADNPTSAQAVGSTAP